MKNHLKQNAVSIDAALNSRLGGRNNRITHSCLTISIILLFGFCLGCSQNEPENSDVSLFAIEVVDPEKGILLPDNPFNGDELQSMAVGEFVTLAYPEYFYQGNPVPIERRFSPLDESIVIMENSNTVKALNPGETEIYVSFDFSPEQYFEYKQRFPELNIHQVLFQQVLKVKVTEAH